MSIDIDEFDFGFTAVDESELEAVQKATTKVESTSSKVCLLYTSPSPRDRTRSRMPSSA